MAACGSKQRREVDVVLRHRPLSISRAHRGWPGRSGAAVARHGRGWEAVPVCAGLARGSRVQHV